jgi:hypothetical protein
MVMVTPLEIILKNVLGEIEGLFTIERYYVKPPGLAVVARPRYPTLDYEAETTKRLTPFGYYVRFTEAGGLVLIEVSTKPFKESRKKYWVNAVLFGVTVVSTVAVGTMNSGGNLLNPVEWVIGVPFAAALLGILLCHEFAHYTASRIHKIAATLPYFIPFPNIVGTMGAFIKMESAVPDRRALLDVGAAGPVAGFVVAVPLTIVGIHLSPVLPATAASAGEMFGFGTSILFETLVQLVKGPLPSDALIQLHPLAFAGWIGLWVTALNLLPIGQLDGGHVVYAMFGRNAVWVARVAFFVLIPLGFLWFGWFLWAVLILLWVRLRHPPPINDAIKLNPVRMAVGWTVLIIFILTFIPVPFSII